MPAKLVETIKIASSGITKFDFQNIPQDGKDLMIIGQIASTRSDGNRDTFTFKMNDESNLQVSALEMNTSDATGRIGSFEATGFQNGTANGQFFTPLYGYILSYANTSSEQNANICIVNSSITEDFNISNNRLAKASVTRMANTNTKNRFTISCSNDFRIGSTVSLYILGIEE